MDYFFAYSTTDATTEVTTGLPPANEVDTATVSPSQNVTEPAANANKDTKGAIPKKPRQEHGPVPKMKKKT